jgi:hypothetical protein
MICNLVHNTRLYNYLQSTNLPKNTSGHFVFTGGHMYNFQQNTMEGVALMMLQQRMLMEGLNLTFIIHD